MNEKIKELIERATTKVEFYPAGCNGYPEYRYDFYKEKFAELIVRECAHLVGGYTKENEFGTDVKEAYEEITKHFGVEQ